MERRNDFTSSAASGTKHNMTLSIISSNGCSFQGISAFDESNTTFVVSGTIDKYGWVEFMETSLRSMMVNMIVKDQLGWRNHVTADDCQMETWNKISRGKI